MAGQSIKMLLRNVRGSYVSLINPNQFDKYQIAALIPKNDAVVKEIRKHCITLAKAKWPGITESQFKSLQLPLRDGDEVDRDGYEGHYYINCKSSERPGVLNKFKAKATEEDLEQYGYSGCYFHVSMVLSAYDMAGNRGIGAYLRNVMLHEVGEGLGGTRAEDDFKDMDTADGATDDFQSESHNSLPGEAPLTDEQRDEDLPF